MTSPASRRQYRLYERSVADEFGLRAEIATQSMMDLKRVYPGYFAAVMATGIVSTILLLYHHWWLSDVLMGVAIAWYLVLWFVYLSDITMAPQSLLNDFKDPSKTFAFFTIVAGSNVLAVRFLLGHWFGLSAVLGTIGLVIWAILFYTAMTMLITGPGASPSSVNGGWLIAIVAEQSISTYLAAIIQTMPKHADLLFLLATTFWAMGVLLYVIFISLIVNRLVFQTVGDADLDPPYWINMGATAISVLASSRLLTVPVHADILVTLRPFLEGVTVMLWAWGSWWIPLLVILGLFKYWRHRERIEYQPTQWSIVFPLGMYATATTAMSQIPGFQVVHVVGTLFMWISVGAWALVSALGVYRLLGLRGTHTRRFPSKLD